jgi:preprotein translocase subunit SecD
MNRRVLFTACVATILFAVALQAQGQFGIHAASAEPVAGWQKMESGNRSVWVNPTPGLVSSDVERALPQRGTDGNNSVTVVFTEAGAKKMRELSAAQANKLVAMILDGKVIFAPSVRGAFPGPDRLVLITGNGPTGLSVEQVQRILVSVNRSQK